MKKTNKAAIISWLLVVINASALFYTSSQPAPKSRELSQKATNLVMLTIDSVYADSNFQINQNDLHNKVRKSAHYFLYLSLGILVADALKKNKKEHIANALLICIAYAIIDETHQYFIPGRGPELNDVLIDTAGASTGILLYSIKEQTKGLSTSKKLKKY